MRIGIFTYDYEPPIGGLGIVASSSVMELKKRYPDDEYLVFSPSPGGFDRSFKLAQSRWRKKGGCPLFSVALNFRLKKIIKQHRLDLIHVHAGSGGVFIWRKPVCPMVVTSHHSYLQEAETVFSNKPFSCFWKKLMSRLEKRTYDLADQIICVSKDTATFLRDKLNQDERKMIVIENGINMPSSGDYKKRQNTLLFIGRLEERKGIWVLLEAFSKLHENMPELRLRIIGENLSGNSVIEYVNKKGLSDCVTVMGFVEKPLLKREISEATAIIVPSVVEGFGLVAAEAMVAGTCVIASDSPGLRSIIEHGRTGLLFRAGDADECAYAIMRVIKDPVLRKDLETKSQTEALRRFSLTERSQDIHQVYERTKNVYIKPKEALRQGK